MPWCPDAVLTLINLEQGASRKATSNQQGIYEFKFLEPGRYQVTASRTGFRQLVKTDLVLTVGQTMRVDFALKLGDVSESISVSDTRSQMLQTDSSEVSQIINSTQVADLPLNGRNFDDLIPLMAGATTGMQGQSNGGYNLNGSRSDSNLFVIEGQSNSDFNNNLLIRPEIDAIQEFQILTATFSAEYGSTGGGIVSIQLKSGGNQFHASLFEFLRNDKLDANNFFANDIPLAAGQTSASREELRAQSVWRNLRRAYRSRQNVLLCGLSGIATGCGRHYHPERADTAGAGGKFQPGSGGERLCTRTHFSAPSFPTRPFLHPLSTRRR